MYSRRYRTPITGIGKPIKIVSGSTNYRGLYYTFDAYFRSGNNEVEIVTASRSGAANGDGSGYSPTAFTLRIPSKRRRIYNVLRSSQPSGIRFWPLCLQGRRRRFLIFLSSGSARNRSYAATLHIHTGNVTPFSSINEVCSFLHTYYLPLNTNGRRNDPIEIKP